MQAERYVRRSAAVLVADDEGTVVASDRKVSARPHLVAVHWRGELLRVEYLPAGQSYWLGDAPGANFVMSRAWLGCARIDAVAKHSGCSEPENVAANSQGEVDVFVMPVEPEPRLSGAYRWSVSGALLLAAVVGVAGLPPLFDKLAGPRLHDIEMPTASQHRFMQSKLHAADDEPSPRLSPPPLVAAAKGEEGAAVPAAPKIAATDRYTSHNKRMNKVPTVARNALPRAPQANLVVEQHGRVDDIGMLALLGDDGGLGDALSGWGMAASAVASAPPSGIDWSVSDVPGKYGLGLSGIGEGGGGKGSGFIGLGRIGIGRSRWGSGTYCGRPPRPTPRKLHVVVWVESFLDTALVTRVVRSERQSFGSCLRGVGMGRLRTRARQRASVNVAIGKDGWAREVTAVGTFPATALQCLRQSARGIRLPRSRALMPRRRAVRMSFQPTAAPTAEADIKG